MTMTEHEQIIEILKSTRRSPVEANQVNGTWMLRAGIEIRFSQDGLGLANEMVATFKRLDGIRRDGGNT